MVLKGEEDSISYLDMLLRGDGEFEELFEVVGNKGQKELKEMFCRRLEKFYLGLHIIRWILLEANLLEKGGYVFTTKSNMIVILYVDDLLASSVNLDEIRWLESKL